MKKTILSFYCDDTNPYCAPPEAFKTFLDLCASEGIAGESSVILGYEWSAHGLINRPTTNIQSAYEESVGIRFTGLTQPGCGCDACVRRHQELNTGDQSDPNPNGVYNLPPNAEDRFGKWLNAPDWVNADYYITADGQAGRIVDLVRAQASYCIFYTHWQGLNSTNGVGWKAFTQVIQRVQKYLHQDVDWMRPSDYTSML